ncbi:hypothetical protein RchiOBHm_Chr2g0141121 [Rosa chinensis]|uniref:Uncharacterized protein n=1 Tax=Rosa chinensis TaxID=74649 RepID=A0A2P6RXJ6_ROSCH|nr:hypothetical protein RchiOBHm_Chr2g0141121 [Rosa chinensis]
MASDINNPDIIRFPNISDTVLYIFLAAISVLFKMSCQSQKQNKEGTDIHWRKSLKL